MRGSRSGAEPEELGSGPGEGGEVGRAVEAVGRVYGEEGGEVSVTLTSAPSAP